MKKILTLFIVIFLHFFIFCSLMEVDSLVTEVPINITTSPAENTANQMNINYHTSTNITSSYVTYTLKTDTSWSEKKNAVSSYEVSDVFDGTHSNNSVGGPYANKVIIHRWYVTLKNLASDSEYMYKVFGNEEVYYFKTSGASEFSFAWISDFHTYSPIKSRLTSATQMINTLLEYDSQTDFILSTGDDVAYGASYGFHTDLYNESIFKKYMFASTIGNHDYMNYNNSKNSNEYFRLTHNNPTNGYSGEEGVSYYFVYSNTLFIFLNNETITTSNSNKAIEWMREVISENKTQYIIVSAHYQWFNGITGATNANYTRFCDFFDEVGVDLAIAGNNHIYVRTKPLYNKAYSSKGTTYIQNTSSDNDRGQEMNPTLSSNADLIEARFTEGVRTVAGINVSVTKEFIKITLLDRFKTVQDQTYIYPKRNDFDITGFDLNEFIDELYVSPSNIHPLACYIVVDKKYEEYVSSIELKSNNKTLGEIDFKYNSISILGIVDYLDVIINLKNLQTITHRLDYHDIFYEPLNLEIKCKSNQFYIEFNNPNKATALIYIDEVLFSETTQNLVLIPSTEVYKNIKVVINNNYEEVSYTLYGDVNLDGFINVYDFYSLERNIFKKVKVGDINFDGEVNLIDLTILNMYLKKKIQALPQKVYTVTINYETYTEQIEVFEGELVPLIEDLESSKFSGYNELRIRVYRDLTYTARYEPNVSRINVSVQVLTENKVKLTSIISPSNAISDVTYFVSDPSIALIDELGIITFLVDSEVEVTVKSVVNPEVFIKLKVTKEGLK